MKNLKSYKAFIIILMIFYTHSAIAQKSNKNDIPSYVLTAFNLKYPKAEDGIRDVTNDEYIAKAKEDHHKYYATFDNNGNWIKTVSKFSWPWHLSTAVKEAFKKCEYGTWHIYGINVIETPSGQFYQIMVDDANHQIDAFHQNLFTENRLVEFKSNGEFIKEKNINKTPIL